MQHLTFCGVGAHHQNGVAERIIKDLTLSSRTLVLHAQLHCPEYITTMVWPYALVASTDRMNNLHVDMNGKTPEMKFSNTIGSSTCLSNFHTFGCPVYILDFRLQSAGGAGPPKWAHSSSSRNIPWSFAIPCRKRRIGYESEIWLVIPTIPFGV